MNMRGKDYIKDVGAKILKESVTGSSIKSQKWTSRVLGIREKQTS